MLGANARGSNLLNKSNLSVTSSLQPRMGSLDLCWLPHQPRPNGKKPECQRKNLARVLARAGAFDLRPAQRRQNRAH